MKRVDATWIGVGNGTTTNPIFTWATDTTAPQATYYSANTLAQG